MNEAVFQKRPYICEEKAGTVAYCTCGFSNQQPYCDGSHKGSGQKPIIVDIESNKRVAWCGCRRSNNLPYCDGSHSKC